MTGATRITVEVLVNRGIEDAWHAFVDPEAIKRWNFASDDWHCPKASNDLREGGVFNYRMESKDGKFGFDFEGEYKRIIERERIEYTLGDREVTVGFEDLDGRTRVVEQFEAESENSPELQKRGWQAILENYKKHAEQGIEKP